MCYRRGAISGVFEVDDLGARGFVTAELEASPTGRLYDPQLAFHDDSICIAYQDEPRTRERAFFGSNRSKLEIDPFLFALCSEVIRYDRPLLSERRASLRVMFG
jgi:hypothetical protein